MQKCAFLDSRKDARERERYRDRETERKKERERDREREREVGGWLMKGGIQSLGSE